MRLTRVLDVAVFLMVAIAILLPRPDVKVKPALELDPQSRIRVAELQSHLLHDPGSADLALELADLLIDGRRPEWALTALAPAIDRTPADHRLHLRRSLALAEHFEAGPAFNAADRALSLCEAGSAAPCNSADHARLSLLRSTLERVKDLDMRKDPNAVKERLIQGFRPTFLPNRK